MGQAQPDLETEIFPSADLFTFFVKVNFVKKCMPLVQGFKGDSNTKEDFFSISAG